MTPRRSLIVAAAAQRDLREIFRHSAKRWGEAQRAAYAASLDQALARLAEFPELGRGRDEIRRGLRSHPVREHVVLYLTEADAIVVLRVIHARMDMPNRFDP